VIILVFLPTFKLNAPQTAKKRVNMSLDEKYNCAWVWILKLLKCLHPTTLMYIPQRKLLLHFILSSWTKDNIFGQVSKILHIYYRINFLYIHTFIGPAEQTPYLCTYICHLACTKERLYIHK